MSFLQEDLALKVLYQHRVGRSLRLLGNPRGVGLLKPIVTLSSQDTKLRKDWSWSRYDSFRPQSH